MKKNCTTCGFAEFERTKSGRRNLDYGECRVKVNLPHSFIDYRRELPTKRSISKYTKPDCPLWEKLLKSGDIDKHITSKNSHVSDDKIFIPTKGFKIGKECFFGCDLEMPEDFTCEMCIYTPPF